MGRLDSTPRENRQRALSRLEEKRVAREKAAEAPRTGALPEVRDFVREVFEEVAIVPDGYNRGEIADFDDGEADMASSRDGSVVIVKPE